MPAPEFVALADLLRADEGHGDAPSSSEHHGVVPITTEHHDIALTAVDDQNSAESSHPDVIAAAREARLFRARLADALDDALARLLRELAADVLARELRLAPCDVREIARRALERAPAVRLRVAAADAGGEYGLPIVVDPALHAGDAVFELEGGSLDARLGVRLASVLDAVCATACDAVSAAVPLELIASPRGSAR